MMNQPTKTEDVIEWDGASGGYRWTVGANDSWTMNVGQTVGGTATTIDRMKACEVLEGRGWSRYEASKAISALRCGGATRIVMGGSRRR